MRKSKLRMLALMMAAPLAAAPLVAATPSAAPDWAAAVSASGRPEAATKLDEVRKPAEVLKFMGLKRGDRALDYFTGTGYYAELMARAVGPKGVVVGWNPAAFGRREQVRNALAEIRQRSPNSSFYSTPTTALSFPASSYDFAMLHLVYHDAYWESAQFGLPRIDPNSVTGALFNAVKPGGIVAVVDHVGAPGGDTRAEVEKTHRIDPAVIRADFERAGFVFEAESNLLRNPTDDKSVNVFDPKIRGKTDRIMYRFRRPAR